MMKDWLESAPAESRNPASAPWPRARARLSVPTGSDAPPSRTAAWTATWAPFRALRGAALLSALFAFGCGDPLVERQRVTELRVLGARYEANDDAERASPLPGEEGRVRWLVAGPAGSVATEFALLACAAEERARGVPACSQEPIAEARDRAVEPSLTFTVPDAPRLLVAGVFCTEGDAELSPAIEDGRCLDPAAEQEVGTYEVAIAADATEINHHPNLDGIELRLDGELWEDDDEPCVARSGDSTLSIALPEDAREARPKSDPAGPFETLQLSHLATGGLFERPFSVFAGDARELTTEVTFTAPESAGTSEIYLVVRDLRGGVSWVRRRLCVN